MYLKMVRAVLEVLFQNREGGHTRQERQEQHERGNIQPGAQRHADYAATPKTDRRGQSDFVATIRALGIRIDDIESNPAYLGSGLSVFSVSFTVTSPELKKYKKHEEIIEALRSLEYVYFVEEMN